MAAELDDIRAEIDSIDREIVRLLVARMQQVALVGEYKRKRNLPLYAPEREAAMSQKLTALCETAQPSAPLVNPHTARQSIHNIYRQIISSAYKVEGGLKVAYLGPEGTWSHQAAYNRFGNEVTFLACTTFEAIIHAVESNQADYGMLPIENSIAGFVSQTLDPLMRDTGVRICSQIKQPVHNCLLAAAPLPPEQLHTITSHPQALKQCSTWLSKHCPQARRLPADSTAAAAQLAAADTTGHTAALGSPMLEKIYKLHMLSETAQDDLSNTTRFVIVGKQGTRPTGKDRTSLAFSVNHTPGKLAAVLNIFHQYSINMLCLNARPMPSAPWRYLFFADVEGHHTASPLKECLEALRHNTAELIILGSYPDND